MSEETKQPVMIFHVSSEKGLNEIKKGKLRGVHFFAETCTQYLSLNSSLLNQSDIKEAAKWICSPPVRDKSDSEALWYGIEGKVLDLVSSDHAPYSFDEKGKFLWVIIQALKKYQMVCQGFIGDCQLFSIRY